MRNRERMRYYRIGLPKVYSRDSCSKKDASRCCSSSSMEEESWGRRPDPSMVKLGALVMRLP